MSRPPKLQKSFSYSSESDYTLESPTGSPEHGMTRHRSFLKSAGHGKRRSSVFSTVLSFLRKAPSPEPEDIPDSVEDEEGRVLSPQAAHALSLVQKHEEAWTQACFNAAAFVFVFITGCICLAVYYVLEPFLHPLMWAVLVGMVLHPFKYAGTSEIKQWLTYLDTSGIPLSLGLLLSPAFVFNWLTQYFEYCFMSSWKTIFGLVSLIFSLFLVYVLNLPLHVYRLAEELMGVFEVLNEYMTQTSYVQVCTLAVGFVILLILTVRGSDYFAPIKVLSVSLWFLVMLNLGTHLIGSVALPMIISTFIVASAIGVFCASFKTKSSSEEHLEVSTAEGEEDTTDSEIEKGLALNNPFSSVLSLDIDEDQTDTGTEEGCKEEEEESVQEMKVEVAKKESSRFGFLSTKKKIGKKEDGAKVKKSVLKKSKDKKKAKSDDEEEAVEEKPSVTFAPDDVVAELSPIKEKAESSSDPEEPDTSPEKEPPGEIPSIQEEESSESDRKVARLFSLSEKSEKERAQARAQSNRVFIVLFTACFVVYVWRHPLLVLLFTPFVVWIALKYAFTLATKRYSKQISSLTAKWSKFKSVIRSRKSVLFPTPIPTIVQLYLAFDKKVLRVIRSSIGGIMTSLIIVSLLIVTTAVTVMLLFEIQVEVMHYVSAALTVWNSTMADSEQINEWIGVERNESTLSAIERFANQNYAYGREWLTYQIRGLIADNTSTIEHHVVVLYDQLYSYFVMNNSSAFATTVESSDVGGVGAELLQDQSDEMSWAELKDLVSNNLEIIFSVLKSMWSILSQNMTVALSFVYSVLEVLFSGGSALINFVVFITALFYLLSYSEEQYLPMKWVTDFLLHLSPGSSPSSGSHDHEHGSAPIESAEIFSRIIRSVFHASFRRAFFYGLYTWLIHTMFGLSVSILPSVLAGIAGAMPFVGSYWVALPAVLELWLVQGQLLMALAVMGLSLLPLFFVDTIINREIEGGHPYLTGLSIAGGIYFAGLEGALIGPILLCLMLFFIDFYSSLFDSS